MRLLGTCLATRQSRCDTLHDDRTLQAGPGIKNECSVRRKSGGQTDPNEIPAARKSHFGNGVWLPHYAAVLAFELCERYRLCARMVLVAGEVAAGLVRVEDPQLRQVRQVGQLYACGH